MESEAFNLTLEQEFQIRLMEQTAQNMTHDEVVDLLLQVSQHLMIKDNVIRSMMKKEILMIG